MKFVKARAECFTGVLTVLMSGILASTAHAQDTVPVVKMVNGTPIDPTTADAYYTSSTTHTAGLCGLNSALCNLARPTAIVELSRSLSRGGALSTAQFTQNVFEYVYKNIDTEFRYGLSKGAFGALLDQSGTPFDQAHLMVELLRQGGVTAGYQAGTISLSGAQFQAWTGLTNAQAACQFLANGGIPAIVNGSSAACSSLSGNVTSVSMAHIWVSANGTLYDPSFKTYIQKTGIDLAAAMGCGTAASPTCGASAIAAGIPSTSQGYDSTAQANYVQNVQYAALGTTLNGFATNLQHYIQQSAPTANVQAVVGGQQIDPASAPTSGGLAYSATTAHTWSGDIPDQYRSRLNIQFNAINTWLFADETYGNWIHVGGLYVNSSSLTATLLFEMERNNYAPSSGLYVNEAASPTNEIFALASGSTSNAGYTGSVTLNIDHPYAAANGTYMDDTFNKTLFLVDYGFIGNSSNSSSYWMSPFLVVQHWGRTGRGSAERAGATASGKTPSVSELNGGRLIATSSSGMVSPLLTSTTMPRTVATWLSQAGIASALIDGFSGTRSQEQHSFGLGAEFYYASQDVGYGLDIWSSISLASTLGTSGAITPSFATEVAAYNALEGSAIEQGEDKPDGSSAIRWFEMTNEQSNRFYQATSSNIASVLNATTNYNNIPVGNNGTVTYLGSQKSFVSSYFSAPGMTFNAVVPKNGSVGTWTNGGTTLIYNAAPMLAYSTDGTQIGYVSTNGLKGGGAGLDPTNPVGAVLASIQNVKPQKPLTYSVGPADGALTITAAPDLVTGSGDFPYSLKYQRSYTSSAVTPADCSVIDISGGYGVYGPQCVNGGLTSPARRLTSGWRDNFEIEADFANDGARALGADSALDASSAIAALYTIRNLAQSPGFVNYLGQAFTAAWLTDQIGANAIVISMPPKTETYIRLPDGTFNPRPGETGKVVQTNARVRYLGPSGFIYKYESITLANTDKEGTQLSFRSYVPSGTRAYLTSSQFEPVTWTFPNGVVLNFIYANPGSDLPDTMTGVANNLGRSLSFAYDSTAINDADGYKSDSLVVTSETGKTVRIRDLSSGQNPIDYSQPSSTKVILPDNNQVRINYAVVGSTAEPNFTDARISSIASPNAPTTPYVSFTWDGLYRAKTATDANGHASTWFPAKVSTERFALGQVSDPVGNVAQTWFDRANHPVKASDPLGRVSAKAYDDIGRLVIEANPLLGCTMHAYDVRGNETTTSQYPAGGCVLGDPGNGQIVSLASSPPAPLVTSSTYLEGATVLNCANWTTCNKPSSQTDANGKVTNYAWDATTGNLTQILKPADVSGVRPQTDLVYTPLGTLASACANSATAGGIALICKKTEKISPSSSTVTSYTYNASNKYVLQSAVQDLGGLNLRTCFRFDAAGNLISQTLPDAALASCP